MHALGRHRIDKNKTNKQVGSATYMDVMGMGILHAHTAREDDVTVLD